jgi:hypothetical protein
MKFIYHILSIFSLLWSAMACLVLYELNTLSDGKHVITLILVGYIVVFHSLTNFVNSIDEL